MSKPRYITIEGPIGVGKTSLASKLAKEFDARLILEKPEENPFLAKFYEKPERYAFQVQTFFLLSRFAQQKELAQLNLFEQNIVSDYLFAKDKIFAYLNLTDDEIKLYEQIYSLLEPRLTKPDLVVYLQARTEVLIERIRKRNKPYERSLSQNYLERVVEAYNEFFFNYNETPLLVVNTSEIDFVNNPNDFAELVKEIKTTHKGIWHYIPLGSR
jgi:deoxyadenosine/deoxycytidine kinase